jgi:hypothetical protein
MQSVISELRSRITQSPYYITFFIILRYPEHHVMQSSILDLYTYFENELTILIFRFNYNLIGRDT